MTIHRTLALLLALAAPLAAEGYRVDAERSQVGFDGKSSLHDFSGHARVTAGAFRLDDQAAGVIEVDATSMNTEHEERDLKMHDEHLESALYPSIRFELRRIGGDDKRVAYGTWTMHGVSREVVIPFAIEEHDGATHLCADFTIDFRRWRVPVPQVMVIRVDPEVLVHVDLAIVRDDKVTIPQMSPRDLDGIKLPDQSGDQHDLGDKSRQRLVLFIPPTDTMEAKNWDRRLSAQLPEDRQLLRVFVTDHPLEADLRERLLERVREHAGDTTFCFDWDARIAERLHIPCDSVSIVGFAADGSLVGIVDGDENAEACMQALALIGIVPDPPLRDLPGHGGRGRFR